MKRADHPRTRRPKHLQCYSLEKQRPAPAPSTPLQINQLRLCSKNTVDKQVFLIGRPPEVTPFASPSRSVPRSDMRFQSDERNYTLAEQNIGDKSR
ncbi:hypothetical protein GWI33_019701 [Rhynchophorus ferrugineus]|uniref:Uncharacterized protein n=1 Tax=Rhynchophorus ferrugineus TaxID=354439 RepID=A0A834M160_RHYFE|nr:hypothetical protein GWI33_019701 [Rhynchophorus ferrugineus]